MVFKPKDKEVEARVKQPFVISKSPNIIPLETEDSIPKNEKSCVIG